MYRQEPPYCLQIEMTEGCNLRCDFCGLNGIRGSSREWKYMTTDTAQKLAGQIAAAGWNSRIEFAMHGEPTLNPDFIEIIDIFRSHLSNQLMMLSNGAKLQKDTGLKVEMLFEAGLNLLCLDDYESTNIVERVKGEIQDFPILHYPTDGPDASPHRRHSKATHSIIIVQDLEEARRGNHSVLTNHCGGGGPLDYSKDGKRCAKPFREFGIRWDGGVAGCCNDFRGVYAVGNIHEASIRELWHHDRMYAMRKKLYHGERDFGACLGCDYMTYRNGLLPDKHGKHEYPQADLDDYVHIQEARDAGPLTTPVLRPWEVQDES